MVTVGFQQVESKNCHPKHWWFHHGCHGWAYHFGCPN
jgi:hypothetical protein